MAGLVPLLGSALALVPLPALVGLVVLSGLQLVNPRALRRASGTRADKAILLATLVATLSIDLVQALYAGVFFSLALLVRRAGSLEMVEIVRAGNGRFREIPLDERTGTTPAVLLHLQGDLNFALAAELADRLRQVSDRAPRVLVLRLKRARYLDATVLEALRVAIEALRARGTTVLMCGLTEELAQVLESSEIAEAVGPDALLRAGPRLFEGFEQALGRARRELAPLADAEIFRGDGEAAPPAPIDYEI
jgi:SulP family sulfate permease